MSSDFYERVLGLRQSEDTIRLPQFSTLYFRPREHTDGANPTLQIFSGEPTHNSNERGDINAVSFSIPAESSARWLHQLHKAGVRIIGRASAFKEEHLCFADPDGLSLSLVENKSVFMGAQRGASVAIDSPIIGFRSVELQVTAQPSSAKFLTDLLGFKLSGREGPLSRFGLRSYEYSDALDLLSTRKCAKLASISPHEHVAWRVADKHALHRLATAVELAGFEIEVSEHTKAPCTLNILGPEGLAYVFAADPEAVLARVP